MAMTALGQVRIRRWNSRILRCSPPPSSSLYPASPRIFWSPPEQKALLPAPVRMMTPMLESVLASRKAWIISFVVFGVNALWTWGRLIVILAMPLFFSYKISV